MRSLFCLLGFLSLYLFLTLLITACRTTNEDVTGNFAHNQFGSINSSRFKSENKPIEIKFKGRSFKLKTKGLKIANNEKPVPSFAKTYLSSMDETTYQVSSARIRSNMQLEGFWEALGKQTEACFSFIFDDFSQDLLIFREAQAVSKFLHQGNSPVLVNLTGNLCVDRNLYLRRIILDSPYNSKNMLMNLSYLLNLDQATEPSRLANSGISKLYRNLGLPALVETAPDKKSVQLSQQLQSHNLFRQRVWKNILDKSNALKSQNKKAKHEGPRQWTTLYKRKQFAMVRHGLSLPQILLANEFSKKSSYFPGSVAYLKVPLQEPESKNAKAKSEFTSIYPLFDGSLASSQTWSLIENLSISHIDLIIQFTKALSMLHAENILHGSLALDKLLFDSTKKQLLLSDLYTSKNIQPGKLVSMQLSQNNTSYQAHEARGRKAYDPFKAEVYSWGLIALEIKQGGQRPVLKEDFKVESTSQAEAYLPKTKPSYRGALVASKKLRLKQNLDRLIFDALDSDPDKRPSIQSVLESLEKALPE